MPENPERPLSAEVVLRSASGKEIAGDTVITAETIAEFAPSAASAERAAAAFRAAGFATSPARGLGFSIEAPESLFRQFFGAEIEADARGGMRATRSDGSTGPELPLDGLDPNLRRVVSAVTFGEPPDFGPNEFGPNDFGSDRFGSDH